jgi:general secretion pathway protein G
VKSVVKKTAFTLVELMIIAAILGILAAIVLPEFQGHIQKAKEAAAKDNLRILREAIERYAAEHNGVHPGYLNDDISQSPNAIRFNIQLAQNRDYLSQLPKNPFNDKFSIGFLADAAVISDSVSGVFGWLYKPSTGEIRLDMPGTDSEGKYYYEY